MCHRVAQKLISGENCQTFLEVTTFSIIISNEWEVLLLCILTCNCIVRFFSDFSHSYKCTVVYHSVNLHTLINKWWWTAFHILISIISFEVYFIYFSFPIFCPIFKWGYFLFVKLYSNLCILNMAFIRYKF
jgi:hypothetical protein